MISWTASVKRIIVVIPGAVFISTMRSELKAIVTTADCAFTFEAAANDTSRIPIDKKVFNLASRLEPMWGTIELPAVNYCAKQMGAKARTKFLELEMRAFAGDVGNPDLKTHYRRRRERPGA